MCVGDVCHTTIYFSFDLLPDTTWAPVKWLSLMGVRWIA